MMNGGNVKFFHGFSLLVKLQIGKERKNDLIGDGLYLEMV